MIENRNDSEYNIKRDLMLPSNPITFRSSASTCPTCNAYSNQEWFIARLAEYDFVSSIKGYLEDYAFAKCVHCQEVSVWYKSRMIYPFNSSVQMPNPDLPEHIRDDYLEARNIVELSPRGAVALLRLALQKLCMELGEKGKHLDTDIKNLVAKGLPEKIQKALDSVRVIGNNAVHPGVIDLKDNREIAYKLFGFINIIADILITQPKQIDEFYELEIPDGAKEAIEKRDGRIDK